MDAYKVLTHFVADGFERTKYENERGNKIAASVRSMQIVILQKDDKYYKLVYFGNNAIDNAKNISLHSKQHFSSETKSSYFILDSLIELEDIVDYLHKIL